MFTNWYRFTVAATLLGMEAQRVMGLRFLVMAAGGSSARAEAQRMVGEKIVSLTRAWGMLALGRSPTAIIRHYRSRVRSNERRLSQPNRR
jgi:hypothetical protein